MSQKGNAALFLLPLFLFLTIGSVFIMLQFVNKNPFAENIKKIEQASNVSLAVAPETEYNNPFEAKTQYVNPFLAYKNPFETLK